MDNLFGFHPLAVMSNSLARELYSDEYALHYGTLPKSVRNAAEAAVRTLEVQAERGDYICPHIKAGLIESLVSFRLPVLVERVVNL